MRFKFLVLPAMLIYTLHTNAQVADTTVKVVRPTGAGKAFLKSLYIAAPLVIMGSVGNADSDDLINKYGVRNERNEHFATFHTSIDNYLQFSPIAAMYAMNAMGLKGRHGVWKQTALLVKSELIMNAIVFPLKNWTKVERPDGSNYHSFPSGHTAQAFLSAELLRKEYGQQYPWLAVGGYMAATATGILRIMNNKHWVTDVMAGAGIGILSVNLAYLMQSNRHHTGAKKLQAVPFYGTAGPGIYCTYSIR